jgi:alkaline phosphatase
VSVAIPGDGQEYETVLEYLKRNGKRTGLVTTTYMTHATPAVFAAHEDSRGSLSAIALDYLLRSRPNVLFGGGRNGINPTSARTAGYTVVRNRGEMEALDTDAETMVSGQFGRSHLPYEHDGLGDLPHLSEMTETALRILAAGSDGFFLMVEGGRIDHACHANDITRCVHEMVEFDRAARVVADWASNRTDTLVMLTADHECGGLTVVTNNGAGNEPDVTWSTTGHTAANVPLYAFGPGSEEVRGVMDNTDVYRIMMRSQPMVPSGRDVALRLGPQIETTWDAKPGDAHRLETAEDLLDPDWRPVMSVTAETHVLVVTDTNAPVDRTRFYRLVSER